jgi:adenine phosphoribosyltransferase
MIKIVLGSKCEIKRQAVEGALREHGIDFELQIIDAPSGVNPQPVGDEAYTGARNRAHAAREADPGAYAIGIENGIMKSGHQWADIAFIAIIPPGGALKLLHTRVVLVPDDVVEESKASDFSITVGQILAKRHGCAPDDPHTHLTKGTWSRLRILQARMKQVFTYCVADPTRHMINIHGVVRFLPIREVAPGVKVALFNILGDWELTEAAGGSLRMLIPQNVEALIMPDGKAQALLHVMGRESGLPTFVARKERKPYMGERVLSVEVKSITTARVQSLHLSEDDVQALKGKRVAIVDDVVSSGGTLDAVKELLAKAGAEHVATLAVFTEGKPREDVIALGHLPLF